jgi:hypothetical protein
VFERMFEDGIAVRKINRRVGGRWQRSTKRVRAPSPVGVGRSSARHRPVGQSHPAPG